MAILETGKKIIENIMGVGRPSKDDVQMLTIVRKANVLRFRDDV